MKYRRGVVIGKFLPPHCGHSHLIETALVEVEHLTVIVCWRPLDPIPGPIRAQWLQELYPQTRVMVIDDKYDENDTSIWAKNTIRWLEGPPDVVHTSESYGEGYAKAMGCDHVLVDIARTAVPISATAIWKDPYRNWEYLPPPVRTWFAKRVCILGSESTGTTTLAIALARRFCTEWVPEYGREYCEVKARRGAHEWTSDEFVNIAREQSRREDEAARICNRLLVCDTNAFATRLWHKRYMGCASDALDQVASNCRCDLYLLTGDEIPFVQDGLRDGEHIRHEMHRWFEEELAAQSVPWLLLRGSPEQRIEDALRATELLFSESEWKPEI